MPDRVVTGDEQWTEITRRLLALLINRYYRSDAVEAADAEAARVIRATFARIVADPNLIPERFKVTGGALDAAAYVASLNDFALLAAARALGVATES